MSESDYRAFYCIPEQRSLSWNGEHTGNVSTARPQTAVSSDSSSGFGMNLYHQCYLSDRSLWNLWIIKCTNSFWVVKVVQRLKKKNTVAQVHVKSIKRTWISIGFITVKVIILSQGFKAALVIGSKSMSSAPAYRERAICADTNRSISTAILTF